MNGSTSRKMRKLLFVISSLEGHGGSERSLCLRVNYLVEKYGYNIHIVTTHPGATSSFYPLNSKIIVTNIPTERYKNRFIYKIPQVLTCIKWESELTNFIVRNDFDICSSLGAETFYYTSREKKIKKIKEQRFTYKKYQTWESCSIIKKIWRRIRFKSIVNTMRRMDCVVSLTDEDASFWRRYTQNVVVIPNFINLNNTFPASLDSNKIISVGRLEKEKDFASLIDAFEIVSKHRQNWKLEIYGNGSLSNELLERVKEYRLGQFVTIVPATKDIFEKYQHASIYVHTAVYEGFSNSVLEALAHRLPVVAFESVGGVKVLVENKYNGFLVEKRSVSDLADRMMMLIDDFELRVKMGEASVRVAERFTEDNVMSMWHDLYSSI